MNKGIDTKRVILNAGLEMASRIGLEGVSIGELAKATKMSKSGLFAHFQSKENLQISILEYAGERFAEYVIVPALLIQSGIPRIQALIQHWIEYSGRMTGGCIFVTSSTEYSDRPGRVRDYVLMQQESWIGCLCRIAESAIKAGDFRKDIDCKQFAFDLYSLLLGFHYYDRLLNDKKTNNHQKNALDRLLEDYKN
jgi:AcrR family transcriptional regulator